MRSTIQWLGQQAVSIDSPAKVNLHLSILGERADGYHNLVSLMAKVSLSDKLNIKKNSSGKITLRQQSRFKLPVDFASDDNLIIRAAKKVLPANLGVDIELNKLIPLGAGLGGGSSNAAATMLALNELFKLNIDAEVLHEIAADLGADVPFFLLPDGFALATGTGTELKPVEKMPVLNMALINPGIAVATAWAYQAYKQQKVSPNFLTISSRNDKKIRHNLVNLHDLVSLQGVAKQMINDLEAVVMDRHPEIAKCKSVLKQHGALNVLMSGSGSTVFGLFPQKKQADEVAKQVEVETGLWCQAVSSLA